MEALAAIGLIGNVITFIDSGAKLLKTVKEVKSSTSGLTTRNSDLEAIANDVREQATNIALKKPTAPVDSFEIGLLDRANECTHLSTELHQLIQDLKPSRPRSKRESIKAVYRNYVKRNEKEALVQKLAECRGKLEAQLRTAESSRVSRTLNEIVSSGALKEKDLHYLLSNVEILRAGVKTTCLAPEAMDQVRSLLKLSEMGINVILQHQILEKLGRDKLTDRFDDIEPAHLDTFSWLLEESDKDDTVSTNSHNEDESFDTVFSTQDESSEDGELLSSHQSEANSVNREESPEKIRAKQDFLNWLTQGQGIFHISGKPGAGKSTLMKLLCESTKTHEHLDVWAAGKTLIVAKFFFWKHGTAVQKSLNGLKMGLLHSTLSQDAGLVQTLFLQQWLSFHQYNSLYLTNEDIKIAFDILIHAESKFKTHKFVFFIDGLDELEGDHSKMIQQLFHWTSLNLDHIKICVSSREWLVFTKYLSHCPKLRLHEITYSDIRKYVQGDLADTREFKLSFCQDDLMGLAEEIVKHAEGVFLWAKIALRNLQQALLVGDEIGDMRKKIYELPRELNDLYQSVFDSIKNLSLRSDRTQAMKIIRLAMESGRGTGRSLLVVYSFLDEHGLDEDFGFHKDIQHLTEDGLSRRLTRTQNQILHLCNGLIEPPRLHPPMIINEIYHQNVTVVHRSILEFLHQPKILADISLEISGFDSLDFYMQGYIATLKTIKPPTENYKHTMFFINLSNLLLDYFKQGRAYESRLIQSLRSLAQVLEHRNIGEILLNDYRAQNSRDAYNCLNSECFSGKSLCSITRLVSLVAIDRGIYAYFLPDNEATSGGPEVPYNVNLQLAVLQSIVLQSRCGGKYGGTASQAFTPKLLSVLDDCLQHYISPNTPLPCGRSTCWQTFIFAAMGYAPNGQILESAIRLLLLYGADPNIWLEVTEEQSEGELEITFSRVTCRGLIQIEGEMQVVGELGIWGTDKAAVLYQKFGKLVHLRELVEVWFPDRAEVLQALIDRNLGRPGPLTGKTIEELKEIEHLGLHVTRGLGCAVVNEPLSSI